MTERQLWMLGRLAELGLNIVEAIERQATRPPPSDAADPQSAAVFHGDLALAYARASRAVRMSIALQARLMGERREQAAAEATQSRVAAVRDRPARRARIDRIVERLAQAEHDDDEAVEQCRAEAAERLDDIDVFGDVLERPVSETIEMICRELGLSPDWPTLAQEAWARQEIDSGAVGAPLAGLSPLSPFSPSPSALCRGPSHPPHVRGP
jgi:hypothetical protein